MINRVPERVIAAIHMEMGTGRRNQKVSTELQGIHVIMKTKKD